MKKLFLYFIFASLSVVYGQEVINVGTSANDHTGDPLRTAFQKVNTNFASVYDSLGYIYTQAQIITLLAGKADIADAMAYPGSGIALSTGSAWGTSITNNSTDWNTAYSDRLKWDGGSTGLTAATGRTSLGGTTVGQALFLLTNPSAIRFVRINADNTVSALSAADQKTALGATTVGNAIFTLTNPSAIRVPLINADNTVTATATTGTGDIVRATSPALVTPALGTPSAIVLTNASGTAASLTAGAVTGYTPASGSLTLSGADAITLTTTNTTSLTIPTSGTLINDADARQAINDSLDKAKADATLAVAVEDVLDGSTGNDLYMSPTQIESYVATHGGSGSGNELRFIINVTDGAPTNADSTIIHSGFINQDIDLYRNGALQYFHTESKNTLDSTYRVNGDTVFVKPLWANNEKIRIRYYDPMWTLASLEGEESSLLTRLQAYYKANETVIHAALSDEVDTQDSQTAQEDSIKTGILSYGRDINSLGSIPILNNDSINPHGPAFSVSMWIKLDEPNGTPYLFGVQDAVSPPVSQPHKLLVQADSTIRFYAYSAALSNDYVTSNVTVTRNTWYHIVAVRSDTLQIYINGVNRSGSVVKPSGDLFECDYYFRLGNASYHASTALNGILDEIGIWSRKLTKAEVIELYNSGIGLTYPFE